MRTGNKANPRQLALIHVAKKQLGLSEEEYREILKSQGGTESAKFLDEFGVDRILRFFHTLGFKQTKKAPKRNLKLLASEAQRAMIYGLAEDLGWSRERLCGFIDNISAMYRPEELNREEAPKIIEALKAMRARKVTWN
jgi:hypothetical protein